jgi:hypothetical protein
VGYGSPESPSLHRKGRLFSNWQHLRCLIGEYADCHVAERGNLDEHAERGKLDVHANPVLRNRKKA